MGFSQRYFGSWKTDPVIRGALREVWFWASVRDVDIVVRHMPGEWMGVVDAPSRCAFDEQAEQRVGEFLQGAEESEVVVAGDVLGPPLPF